MHCIPCHFADCNGRNHMFSPFHACVLCSAVRVKLLYNSTLVYSSVRVKLLCNSTSVCCAFRVILLCPLTSVCIAVEEMENDSCAQFCFAILGKLREQCTGQVVEMLCSQLNRRDFLCERALIAISEVVMEKLPDSNVLEILNALNRTPRAALRALTAYASVDAGQLYFLKALDAVVSHYKQADCMRFLKAMAKQSGRMTVAIASLENLVQFISRDLTRHSLDLAIELCKCQGEVDCYLKEAGCTFSRCGECLRLSGNLPRFRCVCPLVVTWFEKKLE